MRFPTSTYPLTSLAVLPVVLEIALASAVAGWLGSRRVLTASPAMALAGASTPVVGTRPESRVRGLVCAALVGLGVLALYDAASSAEAGNADALIVAFLGSALSGTGLLLGARLAVPRLVQGVGLALGGTPAARVARRNAVADPLRTTRATMGLVVGVTLVTTFATGATALQRAAASWPDLTAANREMLETVLSIVSTVMVSVVVVSALMAPVGFLSTMSLSVIQRRRELGLLRAVGFTRRQVRSMVTRESVSLAGTAVVLGLVLGFVFGSVGAQSVVGAFTDGMAWGMTWPLGLAVAVGALVLVLLAAMPPALRAVAVTPVDALRVDR